ncbi:hypothetical protein NEF87_000827 [Candidatus Lokiarchaeum ossiferum]|uniref:MBL fold metallo-hydrolase n=1 Tax=Candidatus Lokiarchaeum ossiferum TaxID=2951803 RepID=A0ABY6HQ85_9ARCH|nr:hypothetical protein NEF87_000827 [Candidatus Lokiarchaeum sp. B-35]
MKINLSKLSKKHIAISIGILVISTATITAITVGDLQSKIKITYLGQSAFMIEADGKRIYIDPYNLPEIYANKPADGVIITHSHYDHFSRTALNLISNNLTEHVGPDSMATYKNFFNVSAINPFENTTIAGFNLEAIPMYNLGNSPMHAKTQGWCGYIIEIHEIRIFHAGDSDNIPEYEDLKGKIDVACLPIGNRRQTMGFSEASEAIGVIEPEYVIPMHYWEIKPKSFKEYCAKDHPETTFKIMKEGNVFYI